MKIWKRCQGINPLPLKPIILRFQNLRKKKTQLGKQQTAVCKQQSLKQKIDVQKTQQIAALQPTVHPTISGSTKTDLPSSKPPIPSGKPGWPITPSPILSQFCGMRRSTTETNPKWFHIKADYTIAGGDHPFKYTATIQQYSDCIGFLTFCNNTMWSSQVAYVQYIKGAYLVESVKQATNQSCWDSTGPKVANGGIKQLVPEIYSTSSKTWGIYLDLPKGAKWFLKGVNSPYLGV